jgi:hypothetical protein
MQLIDNGGFFRRAFADIEKATADSEHPLADREEDYDSCNP